ALAAPGLPAQADLVASTPAARRAARGGDFECALNLYEEVLARHPSDREALKGRAQVLAWTTRYAEAEQDDRRAPRADPVGLEARTGLALALLRENRFEECEQRLRSTLDLLPRDLESRLLLGEVFLRTDRPVEALGEYERAAAIAPGDPRGRLGWS